MKNKTNPVIDSSALGELVDEIHSRIDAGEEVDIDQLAIEFPEYQERLRRMLPMLKELNSFDWSITDDPSTGNQLQTAEQKTLGDFRILRQIGRGGMGIVYEAQQLTINRKVALKILPLAALVDPRSLQRFKNEVTAIATLEHPHVVSVYSVGEERGIHYFAMQLIRGQSLAAVIRELRERSENKSTVAGTRISQVVSDMADEANVEKVGKPNDPGQAGDETAGDTLAMGKSETAAPRITDQSYFRNAVQLILQAADALQHAHENGIVHRDVKPGNLLLDAHGSLFVTDFGLARIETGANMTATGDVLGTLRYMSPEQVLANRVMIDHRTDIYSLGATLYELITLQPLWDSKDRSEIIRTISFEEPTHPRKINPAIPVDLETIILKAIEKNPDDRYNTAADMWLDLNRFLQRKTILARRPSLRERFGKWVARHRGIASLAVAATVLFSLLATVTAILVWNESQQRINAVLGERAALTEAAEASKRMNAINDFVLRNIVQSAKPGSTSGSHDITVRQSLLAANELIDDAFGEDHLLEAHVKALFGEYLYDIGEYETARESVEGALDVYQQTFGDSNEFTIDTMRLLTKIYRDLNQFDVGLSNAQKVLTTAETHFGYLDGTTIGASLDLGTIYSRQKQYPKAEKIFQDVVKTSRIAALPEIEALANNELGTLNFNQQSYLAAEQYWLSALTGFNEVGSRTNAIVSKINLAKLCWETDRRSEALKMNQETYSNAIEVYGMTHPQALDALLDLATRKFYLNDTEGSISDLRLLLDQTRSRYGEADQRTGQRMQDLAVALTEADHSEEAIEILTNAKGISRLYYGEQHPSYLSAVTKLADAFKENGEIDRARPLYEEAIAGRKVILEDNPDDWRNARSLGGNYCNLGNLLRKQSKDYHQAIDCYTNAIDILKNLNLRHPTEKGRRFLVINYLMRSATYSEMGQTKSAINDVNKAIALTSEYARIQELRLYKAGYLALEGELQSAEAIIEEVLATVDDDGEMFYHAARAFANCASQFTINEGQSENQHESQLEKYSMLTMVNLRLSLKTGYHADLSEPCFDPIRDFAEFKRLVAQMEPFIAED